MNHISNPCTGPVVKHTQEFSGLVCAILGAVIFIMHLTEAFSRMAQLYLVLIRLLAPFRFYLTSHLLLCFIGLFSVFISKASSSIAF